MENHSTVTCARSKYINSSRRTRRNTRRRISYLRLYYQWMKDQYEYLGISQGNYVKQSNTSRTSSLHSASKGFKTSKLVKRWLVSQGTTKYSW